MNFVWEDTAKVIYIPLDWPNINGSKILAGTPISAAGVAANTGSAVGLLMYDYTYVNRAEANGEAAVLIGGIVDLTKVQSDSGITLTVAAKAAMKGITFVVDGAPEPPVTSQMDNIADSTATTIAALKGDFNSLLAALKANGYMAADPEPEPEPDPEPEPEPEISESN